MTPAGRRSVACALFAAAAAFVPASAMAEVTEVSLYRGALEIKASNAADAVTVVAGASSVVIDDPDGVPEAAAPCKGGPPSAVVRCPRKRVDEVVVELGDGNDAFDGDGPVRFEVVGEKGDDEIDGGDERDVLEGKLGDDTIDGSAGGDRIFGGLGNDTLFGKAGRDLLDGGPGTDRGDGGRGKDKCVGIEKASKRDCR